MHAKNPIASLLGHSPFKPMQAHMRLVKECVLEVPPLFEALIASDKEQLIQIQETIYAKEQEADELEHDLFVHLPRSLFMAVDRRDLLDMLSVQDKLANTAQDIAGLLMERDMDVPEVMVEPLRIMVNRCMDACLLAAEIIERLDELIETGFKGREATAVEKMVQQLNDIEDETDTLGRELIQVLFAHEDEMKPVSVMFWYQLIQWIGNLADHAEGVGNRMRLLIAR